ncbi:Gfo/Idh/MocA family protein [Chondromyces apiculatus]|uniref:Putative glucose-fructose oxidoreductase oxidoreductase protein n=1 Tax=Chondromyces apiculatus DSM 436 TaxID=1192034 RepID=A0A017SV66_9BACT|nr:Gfo/Idh/MocA family oxidoreductase [Chondromyces apiculatus]EYF00642.1 putative glucose-fructose oxidoreductase oxidoreductase protein [Chondromyces apiculatus DSM 436]
MSRSEDKRKVRYAVVGAGNLAQVAILPAFQNARENSELVALISGDEDKREAIGERHGIEFVGDYEDYETILESGEVDAVFIALPNNQHREYTERAAKAGVHVLCEKPMAIGEEDCEAMIRATREANVKLMIAYRLHFEEANLRAIEIATSGKLGDVRVFSSVFTQQVRPDDIRTHAELGGGVLYDMGPYCVNAARYLFQAEPEEVFAYAIKGQDGRSREVDETTFAVLRFPGDRLAQFVVSQGLAATGSYRILGTKGDLRVEPAYGYTEALVHHLTVDGETTETTFEKRDQFGPEIVYFSRCILEGKEPEPSGAEGLADVRVFEAILRSAQTGQPVKLTPYRRDQRPSMEQEIHKPAFKPPEPVKAPAPAQK